MVPNKWITKIYELYTLFKNTINIFGDIQQCNPVENSLIHFNYEKSKTIHEMCPNKIILQYNTKTSRYDIKTYVMLTKYLKCGRISNYFNTIDNSLYKNICYLNSTRIKINTICCENFIKEHKLNI